jgi:hypothetical protein
VITRTEADTILKYVASRESQRYKEFERMLEDLDGAMPEHGVRELLSTDSGRVELQRALEDREAYLEELEE